MNMAMKCASRWASIQLLALKVLTNSLEKTILKFCHVQVLASIHACNAVTMRLLLTTFSVTAINSRSRRLQANSANGAKQ